MRETTDSGLRQETAAIQAGLAYFAIVFACGFLLGIVRILFVIPAIGEVKAVSVELPVILAISWLSCRLLIVRFGVAARMLPRLAMGGVAFGLTMVAEAGVSIFVFGHGYSEYVASLGNSAAIMGLLGQLAFALIPAIQLARRHGPRSRRRRL